MSNLDSNKPLNKQNFFKLNKEAKKEWLAANNLSFIRDIILPMVFSGLAVLSIILTIILMALKKPVGVTVLSVFLFLFSASSLVYLIIAMYQQAKGFFIFRYWYVPKPKKQFAQPEAKQQEQKPKQNSSSVPASNVDELEDFPG